MPPNHIESLSRSAFSPALPTAMTTRPQLASSPAIAVFTSGELAIESAILRAEDFDQLARALAVAGDLLRQIGEDGVEGLAECRQPRVGGLVDLGHAAFRGGAGGKRQKCVRRRGVAVDGDRVEGIGHALL